MIRRVNGRSPPFVIVGLIVIILIFAYNYWTLTSQNSDLQQLVDNLQANIKISSVKQEQSDKTVATLKDTVHELKELTTKLENANAESQKALEAAEKDVAEKKFEIKDLKSQIDRMNTKLKNATEFVDVKDYELGNLKKENTLIISQRDDAVSAIDEKDSLILTLKKKLEKVEKDLLESNKILEKSSKPSIVPGMMNIPNLSRKQETNGSKLLNDEAMKQAEREQLILPKDLVQSPNANLQSNVIARPPQKTSSAGPSLLRPNKMRHEILPLLDDHVAGALDAPPQRGPLIQEPIENELPHEFQNIHNNGQEVLDIPLGKVQKILAPIRGKRDNNLDKAVDDAEKYVDDPQDDQDEEGKEIKQDVNADANMDDTNLHDPHDINENDDTGIRDEGINYDDNHLGNIGPGEMRGTNTRHREPQGIGAEMDRPGGVVVGDENFIDNVNVRNLGQVRGNL